MEDKTTRELSQNNQSKQALTASPTGNIKRPILSARSQEHPLLDEAVDGIPESFFAIELQEQLEEQMSFAKKIEEIESSSNVSTDDVIQKMLTEENDTLEVKDRIEDFCGAPVRDRVYKNSNVEYKDGIPKVKGPIVRVDSREIHTDMEPQIFVADLDSEKSKRIAANYGASNYEHTVSSFPVGNVVKENKWSVESMKGLIPSVDVKMFCKEDEIGIAKEQCRNKKEEMANQMNVVALYSVKDSKPFYYISSAEARMAIDYINLCRQFKTDIVKENMGMITSVIRNVDQLIDMCKRDSFDDITPVEIWNGLLFVDNLYPNDEFMEEVSINKLQKQNILSIIKQSAIPITDDNNTFCYQKMTVKMHHRSIKNAVQIINMHAQLNLLNDHLHYVICGKKAMELVSQDYKHKAVPNVTEREIFHVISKYSSSYGVLPVFGNRTINDYSIVMVSKRVRDNDNIVITEYYMDQVPYDQKSS